MKIVWSAASQGDLNRLHDFVAEFDLELADAILDKLIEAAETLATFPRRGERLSSFDTRAVHEFRAEPYLVRYELTRDIIYILRCFHAREDRW